MNKHDSVHPAYTLCVFEMSTILLLNLSPYRSNSFNNNTKHFFLWHSAQCFKGIILFNLQKKKKKQPYEISTITVTTSVIKKLRHRCWTHTEALETRIECRQFVLRAYNGNLSSCLLLDPPQNRLSLISFSAMIPAVLLRNLCKEFVG